VGVIVGTCYFGDQTPVGARACSDEVDAPSAVIAGLDPAIHPFAKMMDPRVKPAGDT
jgi:hypothetical protein